MIVKGNDYPSSPVFTEKEDVKKRKYFTGYANKTTKAVMCFKGKNIVFSGNPKINMRLGESDFGDELFVEFLITDVEESYDSKSKTDGIEIYFPIDEGITFFEQAINYFKNVRDKR